MKKKQLGPKVSIIGGGSVGIRYAYSLMIKGFVRSIVIVDTNTLRTQGEVLDLASGMPYLSPVEITAGDYADIAGSDLVVITAGLRQKPGQSRLELVKDNVELYRQIVPKIMKYAPDAIQLVVTNPVDVLSYAAYKISGKPWMQVIGSGTVLDSARLRFLLSQHCNIDSRNVHAYILGEHGDSEFPVWSKAMVGGLLFKDYCSLCKNCDNKKLLKDVFDEARGYAYKIIERKGETSYGIGLALVRITQAVLKDENAILPVSCLVRDYYGVGDVYMSLPAVVNKKGVRQVLELELQTQEADLLKASAETIKAVMRKVGL